MILKVIFRMNWNSEKLESKTARQKLANIWILGNEDLNQGSNSMNREKEMIGKHEEAKSTGF